MSINEGLSFSSIIGVSSFLVREIITTSTFSYVYCSIILKKGNSLLEDSFCGHKLCLSFDIEKKGLESIYHSNN